MPSKSFASLEHWSFVLQSILETEHLELHIPDQRFKSWKTLSVGRQAVENYTISNDRDLTDCIMGAQDAVGAYLRLVHRVWG